MRLQLQLPADQSHRDGALQECFAVDVDGATLLSDGAKVNVRNAAPETPGRPAAAP